MQHPHKSNALIEPRHILTFIAIALFYFFETAQMSYFNVLAPVYLHLGIYQHNQIASLSAAYYYGDVLGLLPVGIALDHLPLRKTMLWAIVGSIIGAFLLFVSHHFVMQWAARFICGFFGGTFSFVGGIRILANVFEKRFSLFMSLFLSAGMLGALVCQYPLFIAVKHLGIDGPMKIVFLFGILVGIFNIIFLHPIRQHTSSSHAPAYPGSTSQLWIEIISNIRNWADCIMVMLLDTPVSIIGALWGIVLLMNVYHFSGSVSAWIVTILFAGLMLGLPLCGALADRYHHSAWIVGVGAVVKKPYAIIHTIISLFF